MIVRFGLAIHSGRDSTTDFYGILQTSCCFFRSRCLPFLTHRQQETSLIISAEPGTSGSAPPEPAESGVYRCVDGAIVDYQDMRVEADWIEFDPAHEPADRRRSRPFRSWRRGSATVAVCLTISKPKPAPLPMCSGEIEGFYLKAGEYERLADGSWALTKPTATACRRDCPWWHFTLRDAIDHSRGKSLRTRRCLSVSKRSYSLFPEVQHAHRLERALFGIPDSRRLPVPQRKGRSIREPSSGRWGEVTTPPSPGVLHQARAQPARLIFAACRIRHRASK